LLFEVIQLHPRLYQVFPVDSFADCSRRLTIFGAMSSVNNTAYVNDDNTTLNPSTGMTVTAHDRAFRLRYR
jgi:hypothetical protein